MTGFMVEIIEAFLTRLILEKEYQKTPKAILRLSKAILKLSKAI